jgi:methionyl-tRNA synthetase
VKNLQNEDSQILQKIKKTADSVAENIHKSHYKRGIRECMDLAASGNKYFNDMAPWKLLKEDIERCRTVLHICLQIVQALAIITSPFMPRQASKVWQMLGNQESIETCHWKDALRDLPQKPLDHPTPLFPKVDISNLIEQGKTDGLSRCDLKMAEILGVKNHPLNSTLYVLTIDLGTEKREIVAGIKKWYTSKELQGKKIVVLTNISSMAIQGVVSQGMLLATQGQKTGAIITGEGPIGARVHTTEIQPNPPETIDIKEFKKIKLTIDKKGRVIYKKQVLKIKNKEIHTERPIEEGARVI